VHRVAVQLCTPRCSSARRAAGGAGAAGARQPDCRSTAHPRHATPRPRPRPRPRRPQLVISFHMGAEYMCEFKKAEFINGMVKMGCDSLDKLRKRLPELRAELAQEERFREVYNYAYMFSREVGVLPGVGMLAGALGLGPEQGLVAALVPMQLAHACRACSHAAEPPRRPPRLPPARAEGAEVPAAGHGDRHVAAAVRGRPAVAADRRLVGARARQQQQQQQQQQEQLLLMTMPLPLPVLEARAAACVHPGLGQPRPAR
jgi:hypothetical protein